MDVDPGTVGRILLAVGLLAGVCGLVLVLGGRLPFGRLPGDISGRSGNVAWSFPLGTSLVLSIVLSVAITLALRR